jgi:hypothetical protein
MKLYGAIDLHIRTTCTNNSLISAKWRALADIGSR